MNDLFSDKELGDDERIETRIGVHDSNHFEVKLDYSIRSHGRSKYNVDYYFFVPKSLGVNKHSYRDEQFFSDVQAYIRFKTPDRSLSSLTGEDSLLANIEKRASRVRDFPRDQAAARDLSYELRMFGCVARADIRDRVMGLSDKLRSLNGATKANDVLLKDVGEISGELARDIQACMKAWRELRTDFVDGRLPKSSNETFAYVDEFLGRVVEMRLASLLRRIDGVEQKVGKELRDAREECKQLLLSERSYRIGAGYSNATGENEDDHFVYRQGLLKKFVMSVLWLDISKEKEGRRVANVGAAIAAGFAMFVALTLTILAGEIYGLNSWNFIAAGVATYILKDRIKDWLKIFLGSSFSRFLADYSIQIRDPITNAKIGLCRESFGFIELDEVPDEVLRCRRKDAKASIEAMAKPEVVMHYSKQVNLRGKDIIERMHLEDYNLNDIVRFSLSQFLVRADDPTSSIAYFIEETDSVERREFRKVYHLNLVMSLRSKGTKRTVLKRVRVIFDKKAIIELQEVA